MSLTTTNDNLPTDSHALAAVEKLEEEPGFETEVADLGWHAEPNDMANPIIQGVDNEDIWILVRRFNKQLFHVKAVEDAPGNLDLHIRSDEEFSPDKMRANIERLYMTIVVGMMAFAKHVARLRSWSEWKRTSAFCAVYFTAWFFNLLMPLFFTTILTLILYPPSRAKLFPPVPLALIDVKTGNIQKPKSGTLASHDSITGAPEKHPGEAVEQEASNFVTGMATIALSSATETHQRGLAATTTSADASGAARDMDVEPRVTGAFETVVPSASDVAGAAAEAQSAAAGDTSDVKHDKTKTPMQQMMWEQTRPFMHILAELCDTWERFGNALSPTSPFPLDTPRYKLAGAVAPILLVSLFVDSATLVKGTTFAMGLVFFGWPVIWRGLEYLNSAVPKWRQMMELRNTLLRGIPTNAQLTITLLRLAEARKMPIPPPPLATTPPSGTPEYIDAGDLPMDVSQAELDATLGRRNTAQSVQSVAAKPAAPVKKRTRLLWFARAVAKTGVETVLGADRFKAAIGGEHARNRIGILNKHVHHPMGPVDFACRYKGKKGRLFVITTATSPCISFSASSSVPKAGEDIKPLWSVAIEDIVELVKVGGLGWKAKLVVGWAMDTQVADALAVVDRAGERYVVTAMQMRDELFNRLVAMGTQKWEVQ